MAAPAQPAEHVPATQTTEAESGRTGANAQDPASASPTPASSSPTREQDSRGPDYFREAFSRIRGYTQTAKSPDPAPQAPPASEAPGQEPERAAKSQNGTASSASPAAASPPPSSTAPAQKSSPGQPGSPGVIQLTPEELQRRVQSEADRVLAKRLADEQAKREREEELELRRNDPFEYARRMEEKEQQLAAAQADARRATDLLTQQLTHYDRGILDPIVGALSDTARKKILDDIQEEGIPGRQKIAQASLQALRQQWIAEGRDAARAALMKDQPFIKEILARYGGQNPEPEASPVLPPGSGARTPTSNESVNAWMRKAGKETRYVSGTS